MPQKQFLEAGKLVGLHGVRGEMRMQPWCDSPEQLAGIRTLYRDAAGTKPLSVTCRAHKNMALVKIEGVDSPEQAASLRNQVLFLDRKDLKLPEGQYFIQDLIGLTVTDDASGEEYGTITDVMPTGANDVYAMKTNDDREILIPAIPQIVQAVDVAAGVIRIVPMKGLLDDED